MPGWKTPEAVPQAHVVSVEALWHGGKTHFACTAPGGIAIQSTDFSTDGVVQPFVALGKDIRVAEYQLNFDTTPDDLMKEGKKEDAAKAADRQADRINNEVWKPFVRDLRDAVADDAVRSIVWDTADQVNEILRLANHGKLEKNPEMAYGAVNAEYKNLVRSVKAAKKNMILLHRLGDKYESYLDDNGKEKSRKREGVYERKGNSSADFLVESIVRLTYVPPKEGQHPGLVDAADRDPGTFKMTIKKARLNPSATGLVLDNPTWAELMSVLMPEVPSEYWEDKQ